MFRLCANAVERGWSWHGIPGGPGQPSSRLRPRCFKPALAEEPEEQSEKKGEHWMDKGFVYWDNSNIFHEAQRLTEQ